jgi:hypothetical protein
VFRRDFEPMRPIDDVALQGSEVCDSAAASQ